MNDTAQIKVIALTVKVLAWSTVVGLPLLLATLAASCFSSPTLLAGGLLLLAGALGAAKIYFDARLQAHVAQKATT